MIVAAIRVVKLEVGAMVVLVVEMDVQGGEAIARVHVVVPGLGNVDARTRTRTRDHALE